MLSKEKNLYFVEQTTKTTRGKRKVPIPRSAIAMLERYKKLQELFFYNISVNWGTSLRRVLKGIGLVWFAFLIYCGGTALYETSIFDIYP